MCVDRRRLHTHSFVFSFVVVSKQLGLVPTLPLGLLLLLLLLLLGVPEQERRGGGESIGRDERNVMRGRRIYLYSLRERGATTLHAVTYSRQLAGLPDLPLAAGLALVALR